MNEMTIRAEALAAELLKGLGSRFYIYLALASIAIWVIAYCVASNCPLVILTDRKDGTAVAYGLRGRVTDWKPEEDEEEDEEEE